MGQVMVDEPVLVESVFVKDNRNLRNVHFDFDCYIIRKMDVVVMHSLRIREKIRDLLIMMKSMRYT